MNVATATTVTAQKIWKLETAMLHALVLEWREKCPVPSRHKMFFSNLATASLTEGQ